MTKAEKFDLYYNLIIEWNGKFNLTAVTERNEVEFKHFRDSILGEKYIPIGSKVLDVGSGAGFPGIPLKIVRDDLDITLLDSVRKKVNFLEKVIEGLSLKDIRAVHSRIEDFKGHYDVVVSRAVAPLNVLSEYCLPFVKKGGIMLAYKSNFITEEVLSAHSAITFLGGTEPEVHTKNLTDEIIRSFVIIKKAHDTPKGYPRGGNKPRLKPL